MEVGVRTLRNDTASVIEAVESGERVVLTVHGRAVADIVPHQVRRAWLSGDELSTLLVDRAADAQLTAELDELAGQTLDDAID